MGQDIYYFLFYPITCYIQLTKHKLKFKKINKKTTVDMAMDLLMKKRKKCLCGSEIFTKY